MRLFSAVALASTLALAFAAESLRGTTTTTTTNFAAWAGEEDKAAWAGIEDPLRVSVNAIRVSDNLPPLAAEPTLSKAALELAKDLATADSATLDEKAGGKALLDRAKAFGFNGTAVKANLFTEDVPRTKNDTEAATVAFVKATVASKDAFAGLEDPTHQYVGSGAWFSGTNKVYYAQLYGK